MVVTIQKNIRKMFEKIFEKKIAKDYVMKRNFFKKVKEKHSVSEKSVCICRERKKERKKT